MDATEFRERGQEMIDYIVDYIDSVSERRVNPDVLPGYLDPLLPLKPPKTGESFEKIMRDLEKYILPGMTHWQHRRFHAYFPATTSYPTILAEMLSDNIGCDGFNWDISPGGIDLENIVTDWFGKMIGLPDKFIHYSDGNGGGSIENSASENIFMCMYVARQNKIDQVMQKNESLCQQALSSSLVAYCSSESHSCVEKAASLLMVCIRVLDTDENYRLRGKILARAIEEDKKRGRVPFFASICLGSTSSAACDPIDEIGPICESEGVWLHVDAAYAGNAMICPEFRPFLKGIEYASSFNVNPVKWILINIDCAVVWTTDRSKLIQMSIVDKSLLYYDFEKPGTHTSRKRFRALKMWFVMRTYGVEGLQAHIRNHVRLAKIFENYVRGDERFELMNSQFGLVCFRMKGCNMLTKKLLMRINSSAKLHVTASKMHGKYVTRFCICHAHADESDIDYAWSVFCEFASQLLRKRCPNSKGLCFE